MNTIYFTITGTKFRFGDEFMEPGMAVRLVKEPDNEYDALLKEGKRFSANTSAAELKLWAENGMK